MMRDLGARPWSLLPISQTHQRRQHGYHPLVYIEGKRRAETSWVELLGTASQLRHTGVTKKRHSEIPSQFMPSLNEGFMSTVVRDPQEVVSVEEHKVPTRWPRRWSNESGSQ